jgi:nucleotide-binding universal stress UspA family protein
MIVVGARGLSALQSTVLGSVPTACQSRRPVLVMPAVKR